MFTYPIISSGIKPTLSGIKDVLVDWWDCEEATGTSLTGEHSAYVMTDFNSVPQVTGKVGPYAKNYNGAGSGTDYHMSTNATVLSAVSIGASGISMGAWVNLDALVQTGTIISLGSGSAGTSSDYQLLYNTSTNVLQFGVWSSGGTASYVETTSNCTASQWDFVYAEYNAADDTISIAMNDDDLTTNAGPATPNSAKGRFIFGTRWGTTERLDGSLDEIFVCSAPLSDAQRLGIWNGGTGVAYTDLP